MPQDDVSRQSTSKICIDARLDLMLRGKLEDLAVAFHRARAAVLGAVMRWGLSRGYAAHVDDAPPSSVRHLFIMVDPNLHQQVHEAAKSAGVDGSPWLRH
jgi:hypothetical protein